MSVAFRRDGDEEHLEPRFEIPLPPGPNLVTPRGKALIDARVAELAEKLSQAPDDAAKTAVQRDLRYWQSRQITAEVMPPPSGNRVAFGTTVRFTHKGRPRQLAIVGSDEADGAEGLIAFTAPLARALLGAEAGDVLPFGGSEDALEVLEVSPSEF